MRELRENNSAGFCVGSVGRAICMGLPKKVSKRISPLPPYPKGGMSSIRILSRKHDGTVILSYDVIVIRRCCAPWRKSHSQHSWRCGGYAI